MTRWLVDGMNVVGSRPDGWWRDRPQAVAGLVPTLDDWAAAHGEAVTVVFDGTRPDQLRSDAQLAVEAVFTGRGHSADDEIARRVAADPDPGSLVVVTSDAELSRRIEPHGVTVVGAGSFRRRLEEGR